MQTIFERKFKRGYVRPSDGKIFLTYYRSKLKDGTVVIREKWRTKERFEEINAALLSGQIKCRQNPKVKIRQKEYRKKYRLIPEKLKAIKEYQKKYYIKHQERLKRKQVEYAKSESAKILIRKNRKRRAEIDPQFVIGLRVRNRILRALKKQNASKSASIEALIGCSFDFLKEHIESQFSENMSWENRKSFHLDHIIPLSAFDLQNQTQLKIACNWRNLQPLSPLENMRKNKKITKEATNKLLDIIQETDIIKL